MSSVTTTPSSGAVIIHRSARNDDDVSEGQNRSTVTTRFAYIAFQSIIGATAGYGFASRLTLSPIAICVCVISGALVSPIFQKIHDISIELNLIPAKKCEMTRERALDLLHVPADKADDREFIEILYQTLLKKITPKKSLGRSALALEINELLSDIHAAHRTLLKLKA